MPCEIARQSRRRSAAADFADARTEIAAQVRRRERTERRDRREAVDHRHVGKNLPHAVAAAVAVARGERLREPFCLRGRMARQHEIAGEHGRHVVLPLGIQRVATEKVNLFELREQRSARRAARRPFHLVDRQELARFHLIGEELVAAVVMARDHQHVAADLLLAGRREPIGAPALDQFDELILIRRKAAPKRFFFVGRVDGDRADRFLAGGGAGRKA